MHIQRSCNLFLNDYYFLILNSQTDLDNICYSLSPDTWVNPHKSTIGLGNYDVNVVRNVLV